MNQKETVLSVMKDANKPLRSGEISDLAGRRMPESKLEEEWEEISRELLGDKKEVDKAMKEAEALIFSPKRCCWQSSG